MKPTIKPGLMIVVLASLLCSCYSHKNITKKKSITPDFLSTLETGKWYAFELMIGQIQAIYVTGVDGQRVTGYYYPNGYNKKNRVAYDESFENIAKYVAKIYKRKVDPVKTTLVVLASAIVIIPLTLKLTGDY